MVNLTAKQESFIALMSESDELERRGVEILLKRPGFDEFFDALNEAGLFKPERNPAPVPAEEAGFYRVPYWPILDYLKGVAKLSGERNDVVLSEKVMSVIRNVSRWRDAADRPCDNYVTNSQFAEMLSLVPTAVVTEDDIGLIPGWLSVQVGKRLIGNIFAEHVLPRLVASPSSNDLIKAIFVLRYCLAIEWRDAKELGERERVAIMAVDDYTARQIVAKYARTFGLKTGEAAASIFADGVREVFSSGTRKEFSYLHVPAVEDHAQNHVWREVENCVVVGLRETLLGWCDAEETTVLPFIDKLLSEDSEILHRVAIYVIGQRWALLHPLYKRVCEATFFTSGHLHELFHLLQDHFADLSGDEQAATLNIVRALPLPQWGDDPARALRWSQLRWLAAIGGKGYAPADQWIKELESSDPPVRLSEHPDFNSYMGTRVGPGPSPYSPSEIAAFAEAGVAVEKINSFAEHDVWNGPTVDGLAKALEDAVQASPESFLKNLQQFLKVGRRYQSSLISSLQRAWETASAHGTPDWKDHWEAVLSFFESLVTDQNFWDGTPTSESYRDWVVSVIADFLRSGTTNDDHAFSPVLLPRAQGIIRILLDRGDAAKEPGGDPMFTALNTPKGRAIESLFSHSLRTCRVSDRASGTHTDRWRELQPLFDSELEKCQNANFEFSTLCGAYLSQLEFLGGEWIKERILQVFPTDFPLNAACAISGLGHAAHTHSVFALLSGPGILDKALLSDVHGRGGRENVLARIASGYLGGDEDLESSRFRTIFEHGTAEDLKFIASVFWSIRGETIRRDQRAKIRAYWSRCVAWSAKQPEPAAELLSSLSRLACFLETADGEDRKLLEAVAPYVYVEHSVYEFLDELTRLVETSPEGVSAVLGKMTESRTPDFDYRDQLRKLLEVLIEKGRKEEVIFHAERLRRLPGMQELYNRLTAAH